jgi:hypothetical protein
MSTNSKLTTTTPKTPPASFKPGSYRVIISKLASQKIHEWTDLAPGEISGLGVVDTVKNDEGFYELHVKDVWLLKQECTGHDTELDDGAVADLMIQWMDEGEGNDQKPLFWWHSHVNMGVFWSGTDDQCVRNLIDGAHDEPGRFLLSTVVNKRGEFKTRMDMAYPFHQKTDDMQTTFKDLNKSEEDGWKDIAKAFVASKYDFKEGSTERTKENFHASSQEMISLFADWAGIKDNAKMRSYFNGVHIDEEIKAFCKKEYDEKVTTKSAATYAGGYVSGYYNNNRSLGYQKGPETKVIPLNKSDEDFQKYLMDDKDDDLNEHFDATFWRNM